MSNKTFGPYSASFTFSYTYDPASFFLGGETCEKKEDDRIGKIISETYFTAAEGGIGARITHDGVYQGEGDIHHEYLGKITFCVLITDNGKILVGMAYGDDWKVKSRAFMDAVKKGAING